MWRMVGLRTCLSISADFLTRSPNGPGTCALANAHPHARKVPFVCSLWPRLASEMEDLDRKAALRTAALPRALSEEMHGKLQRVPVDADGCAYNTQQRTTCKVPHAQYTIPDTARNLQQACTVRYRIQRRRFRTTVQRCARVTTATLSDRQCRRAAADDRVSPLVHSLHSLPPLSAVPALALSPAIARPLSYVRAGTDGAPTDPT